MQMYKLKLSPFDTLLTLLKFDLIDDIVKPDLLDHLFFYITNFSRKTSFFDIQTTFFDEKKSVLQVSGRNTFENAYKITSKSKFSTQNMQIPYHLHPALSISSMMSVLEIDDASDFVLPGHSEDLNKSANPNSGESRINSNESTRSAKAIARRSADFGEDIKDMAVFDDPMLLKGSCVWQLMHGAGDIFTNSEGSAESYELSSVQQSLDAFISHNWSVPRHSKFFCLLYHYNAVPALIAGLLASSAVMLLIAFGFLPLFDVKPQDMTEKSKRSLPLCTLAGFMTSMVILFTYHELRLCLTGWRGPKVYLDKTCIHQTDINLQTAGIRKLGAFLRRSRCMVVLYGQEYLQKLWTVYELASFLTLCPGSQIWVIPLSFPTFIFISIQVAFLRMCVRFTIKFVSGYSVPATVNLCHKEIVDSHKELKL